MLFMVMLFMHHVVHAHINLVRAHDLNDQAALAY